MGFIPAGPLYSWEVNCGSVKDEDIKPGEEKFCLPEGTAFKLVCGGRASSSGEIEGATPTCSVFLKQSPTWCNP